MLPDLNLAYGKATIGAGMGWGGKLTGKMTSEQSLH